MALLVEHTIGGEHLTRLHHSDIALRLIESGTPNHNAHVESITGWADTRQYAKQLAAKVITMPEDSKSPALPIAAGVGISRHPHASQKSQFSTYGQ
jgi:hypothetical protein